VKQEQRPIAPESLAVLAHLNNYLSHRYNLKRDSARPSPVNSEMIDAKRAAFGLYFRVAKKQLEWPHGTLVISRIYFRNKRQGNGRSLVTFLSELGRSLGYQFIGIESPNENSRAFAARLGFATDPKWAKLLLSLD
jgi:hypothetical protein